MTGFLNIWKEEGVSSAAAVNRVKWLTREPCGHMGTLDPLASGILPVGIGKATRLFDYFLQKSKTYCAFFRFGATTRTLDRESDVEPGGRIPSAAEIEEALKAFTGEIVQVPPAYSAKNVDGKRSYELARAGREVALAPVSVHIDSFRLLEQTAADEFRFEIVCGKGTYIRALARDLAAVLGTNAYMSGLVRTACGAFTQERAVRLSSLNRENWREFMISVQDVLPFPVCESSDERLLHGLSVPTQLEDGRYQLFFAQSFYGLARAEGGFLKAEKKLC